jgi:hypothetical protein
MSKFNPITKINKNYQIILDQTPEWIEPEYLFNFFNAKEKLVEFCSLFLTTNNSRYIGIKFFDENRADNIKDLIKGCIIIEPKDTERIYNIKICQIPPDTWLKIQITFSDKKCQEKQFPTRDMKKTQFKYKLQHITHTMENKSLIEIEPNNINYINQHYQIIFKNIPDWLTIKDLHNFWKNYSSLILPNFSIKHLNVSVIITEKGEIWMGTHISNNELVEYIMNHISGKIQVHMDESKSYQIQIEKIPSNEWIVSQLTWDGHDLVEKLFPSNVRFNESTRDKWQKIDKYLISNQEDSNYCLSYISDVINTQNNEPILKETIEVPHDSSENIVVPPITVINQETNEQIKIDSNAQVDEDDEKEIIVKSYNYYYLNIFGSIVVISIMMLLLSLLLF